MDKKKELRKESGDLREPTRLDKLRKTLDKRSQNSQSVKTLEIAPQHIREQLDNVMIDLNPRGYRRLHEGEFLGSEKEKRLQQSLEKHADRDNEIERRINNAIRKNTKKTKG